MATEKCPQCEGPVRIEQRVQQFQYGEGKGSVVLSATVPVVVCAACDEVFSGGDAEDARHEAVCAHLGRLSPAQMKAARARLHLTQERLAELTGFGIASIKRWESAHQIQNESADRFLRLLFSNRSALASASSLAGLVSGPPVFKTKLGDRARRAASVFRLRESVAA